MLIVMESGDGYVHSIWCFKEALEIFYDTQVERIFCQIM